MQRCFITTVLALLAPFFVFAQSNLKDARPEDIDLKTLDAQEVKSAATAAATGTAQKVRRYQQTASGVRLETTGGILLLQPVGYGILHVRFESALPQDTVRYPRELLTAPLAGCRHVSSPFSVAKDKATITVSTADYQVRVDRRQGFLMLLSADGTPLVSELPGAARINAVGDSVCPYTKFRLTNGEAVYGLGQFRDGRLNLRHCERELVQFNTQAAVPVLYSTAGWGILWNNPSRTIYRDDDSGLSFLSDYGNVVDYYLFVGNSLDSLIARYRSLTGHVPMLPEWALGFHQSRNRYHNRAELMDVVRHMHDLSIPMASIFIDYHYWGRYGTGAMRFDEAEWPGLTTMLDSLHLIYNTHAVITQWPCFKPGTPNYNRMAAKGYLLDGARAIDGIVYDVFNPAARREYRLLIHDLLRQGIDGWFLDGPEPDHIPSFLPTQTYLGSALRVRNLYPLYHIANFHEALSEAEPGRRHYMLTRCAYTGQQRYGTAVWSGDIPNTFEELRKQVAAGLSFTATGQPYWTTDIGGYMGGDPAKTAYREVFTRWFEWGTFCPIFRSHGRRDPFDTTGSNELWAYGDTVQRICTDYIRLRYRLMPYIYSLSAMTSFHDYTPIRLLAFDFPADTTVIDLRDEFMYGPAFLVCPVIEAGALSRKVYLPKVTLWYDYWTGRRYAGGQTITASAPLHRLPLYVRAGSIIPMMADTIAIYPGADADFSLYEDDGLTKRYEQGDTTLIRFHWDNVRSRLSAVTNRTLSEGRVFTIRLMGDTPRCYTLTATEITLKGKDDH